MVVSMNYDNYDMFFYCRLSTTVVGGFKFQTFLECSPRKLGK